MSTDKFNQGNELIIAEPDGTLKRQELFFPLSLGLPVTLPNISIRKIGRRNDNNQTTLGHDSKIVPAS